MQPSKHQEWKDGNEAVGTRRDSDKEEVRCEVLIRQKEPRLSEKRCEDWCEEATDGLGSCEWRGQAVGIAPAEGLKLRRMAAAGKKESVSSSLFMDVNNLEVEEDSATMATLLWGGSCVDGNMEQGAAEGVKEADLRSTDMETRERARSSDV